MNETENLAVLKGNCDAEVDQMVSKFRFVDGILEVDDGEKRLLFTHGHVFSRENLPEGAFDLLCYGHFTPLSSKPTKRAIHLQIPVRRACRRTAFRVTSFTKTAD